MLTTEADSAAFWLVRRRWSSDRVGTRPNRPGARGSAVPHSGTGLVRTGVRGRDLATDVTGGARYGYRLLWVVVLANLLAMLVQYLAAKLGVATGKNLPELCRDRYRKPVCFGLWLQAEAVVIMTDLAEVIGGGLGLRLLFGIPLALGGVLMAGGMMLILALQRRGRRAFEAVVVALLAVVLAALLYQLLQVRLDPAGLARGMAPTFVDGGSVVLACGIVGATVMPHAIYLHGGLTQRLGAAGGRGRRFALRMTRLDVLAALGLAGLVNIGILLGATALHGGEGDSLGGAQQAFADHLGALTGWTFGIALLASGLAGSAVGVASGQIVMAGFLRRSIPLWLRRSVSIVPAVLVLAAGVDATNALVASQVALSFGLPFALVPLLTLTSDRPVMGELANRRPTIVLAGAAGGLVIALNLYLVTMAVRG